jgi:cyclic beta-1,2-glucan synthetase
VPVVLPIVDSAALIRGRGKGVQLPSVDVELLTASEHGTAFLYPTIIQGTHDVDVLIDTMRANLAHTSKLAYVSHVVLADFPDAATPFADGDDEIRRLVESRVDELATGFTQVAIGVLFRERRPGADPEMWLGWERKRGKLLEFARLSRGTEQTSFIVDDSPPARTAAAIASTSVFAITVDAGAALVADSAARLVAAMAHPSNRPVVDPRTATVLSGRTFLRAGYLTGPPETLFERIAFGAGHDEEGPSIVQRIGGHDGFYGQGIFDLDAACHVLGPRLPHHRVLSHDTLEGAVGGAGKIEGTLLLDGNPATYATFRKRQHRWARGDFQNVSWTLGRNGATLNTLPRWQLFVDYLDQLIPVAAVALALLPPLAAGYPGLGLTALVVVLYFLEPVLLSPIVDFVLGWQSGDRPRHVLRKIGWGFCRQAMWLSMALDQAVVAADAFVRSAWRMRSGRRLLEWTPDSRRTVRTGPLASARASAPTIAIGLAAAALGLAFHEAAVAPVAALSLWWAAAPGWIWLLDRPLRREHEPAHELVG